MSLASTVDRTAEFSSCPPSLLVSCWFCSFYVVYLDILLTVFASSFFRRCIRIEKLLDFLERERECVTEYIRKRKHQRIVVEKIFLSRCIFICVYLYISCKTMNTSTKVLNKIATLSCSRWALLDERSEDVLRSLLVSPLVGRWQRHRPISTDEKMSAATENDGTSCCSSLIRVKYQPRVLFIILAVIFK